MIYAESADTYIYHNGKCLSVSCIKHQKSKNGYKSEVTVYECENCEGCPQKEKCTKAKGNKKLYVSKKFIEQRWKSYENIMSHERTGNSFAMYGMQHQ